MSDIGPGDIVRRDGAAERNRRFGLTNGALYRVKRIEGARRCVTCRRTTSSVMLFGKPASVGGWYLCPCGFRKWPPPPSEELLSEDVDTDVKEPV